MLDEQYKDLLDSWEEQPPQEAWLAIEKALKPWYALPFGKAAIFTSVLVVSLITYYFVTNSPTIPPHTASNSQENKNCSPTWKPRTKEGTATNETIQSEEAVKTNTQSNQVQPQVQSTQELNQPNLKNEQAPNSASSTNSNTTSGGQPTTQVTTTTIKRDPVKSSADYHYSSALSLKLSANQICIGKVVIVKVDGATAGLVLDFGDQHQLTLTEGKNIFQYCYLQPGVYNVSIKQNNTNLTSQEIIVDEKAKAYFKTRITENTSVEFENFSIASNRYMWLFDDRTHETHLDKAPVVHYFASTSRRVFNVKLIAMNVQTGCSDTFESEVKNPNFRNYFSTTIPNVFTPNNDGLNDVFEIPVSELKEWYIIIMDASGKVVFETNKQSNFWNGKLNNQGNDCSNGMYRYIIKYMQPDDDEMHQKSGFITLLRE